MSTDLDRRVAQMVGWEWTELVEGYEWEFEAKECMGVWDVANLTERRPSDRIPDAIAALEAMREKGWHRCILYMQHGEYTMVLHLDKPRIYGRDAVSGVAETLPLAICKAIIATEEK